MKSIKLFMFLVLAGTLLVSCKKDKHNPQSSTSPQPKDPNTAPVVAVDRFSSSTGHLQVRTSTNGLPGANVPVNFDQGPFITKGKGPNGEIVQYYNFDIQPAIPAPIYVLFRQGDANAVTGQLNIIDVTPGDSGYNDFWQIHTVTVPSDYVANTVTSFQEIQKAGYTITSTNTLVNCPVVPKGSTASLKYGGGTNAITTGWYKDSVVYYFSFGESPLTTNASGQVPTAPIYVTFNINPDQPNGGPSSGFEVETGTTQTHNVIYALPGKAGYSPLWVVDV
jgi:hypothetical protein